MLNIHQDIKSKLNNFISEKKIPNIIFHGSNGSGKKTILMDFIKDIYKNDKEIISSYVLTVNCAHGKGIRSIREDLKFFARTNINFQEAHMFKSIILLNADKLTIDAQSALRRCIELFSHSTRFFIIVDDKYKLLRPILSRFCEIFIPEPKIKNQIINLHRYNLETVFPIKTSEKQKQLKFKKEVEKEKITSDKQLLKLCDRLYEKGFSALDLMKYIENSDIEDIKKFEYLIFIQKIKREFRDEKLLMMTIFHFLLIRSDYKLENISFM